MANFEGFGEESPSQSRRPGLENMSERVQLISYSIYDELEIFVDSFGRTLELKIRSWLLSEDNLIKFYFEIYAYVDILFT